MPFCSSVRTLAERASASGSSASFDEMPSRSNTSTVSGPAVLWASRRASAARKSSSRELSSLMGAERQPCRLSTARRPSCTAHSAAACRRGSIATSTVMPLVSTAASPY